MILQKRKHLDLLKGLADDFLEWWIQVLSTVLHQQEKSEYEGEIMTRSAPSTLSTWVNVTDLDAIGEDLGFICLQFFPVAAEVRSPRSLIATWSAFSSQQEGFSSDNWAETTYSY